MFQSKILGLGHYLPKQVITNDDIVKMGMDTSDQWITERTGIKERRISSYEKGELPSFMGTEAAKMAIKNSGLELNEIDLILNSNTFPDYIFPNTASLIQANLGMSNQCACLDVNAACSGWIYAMVFANSLIQNGTYKNILVLGNEMTSSMNTWKDRSTSVLFGDGCGAAVLSRSDEPDSSRILQTILGNDGTKAMALKCNDAGAGNPVKLNDFRDSQAPIQMDGQVVFKTAVKTMTLQCQQLLEKEGITKDQVDLYIPHQANLRIIEAIARRFEFPREKVFINVEKYANTSSASIPIALSEAFNDGRMKRGSTILMSAFGAGLSSAAMLLKF